MRKRHLSQALGCARMSPNDTAAKKTACRSDVTLTSCFAARSIFPISM